MEAVLALAILAFTAVFALSVFQGKPFKVEITHILPQPPTVIPITETEEETRDDDRRKELAQAIQEIMGVFRDDGK